MNNEALRLAVLGSFRGGLTLGEVQEAEDELNRLVAQRDALLEALRAAVADWDEEVSKGRWLEAARAAIKKAEEA